MSEEPQYDIVCRLYPEYITSDEVAKFTTAAAEIRAVRVAVEDGAIVWKKRRPVVKKPSGE